MASEILSVPSPLYHCLKVVYSGDLLAPQQLLILFLILPWRLPQLGCEWQLWDCCVTGEMWECDRETQQNCLSCSSVSALTDWHRDNNSHHTTLTSRGAPNQPASDADIFISSKIAMTRLRSAGCGYLPVGRCCDRTWQGKSKVGGNVHNMTRHRVITAGTWQVIILSSSQQNVEFWSVRARYLLA